ncbi:MAG: calcium-binding protein [Actinomycetota bacterium]
MRIARLSAVVTMLVALIPLGGGEALAASCDVSSGVTQVGPSVTGTPGDDVIDCSDATTPHLIFGGPGDDDIFGSEAGDTIDAGDGDDNVDGFLGNDTILGGPGDDVLLGAEDNDVVAGGPGNDILSDEFDEPGATATTNDTLDGGPGADVIFGGPGSDTLTGPPLDLAIDTLDGGQGVDACLGPGPDGDVLLNCP